MSFLSSVLADVFGVYLYFQDSNFQRAYIIMILINVIVLGRY